MRYIQKQNKYGKFTVIDGTGYGDRAVIHIRLFYLCINAVQQVWLAQVPTDLESRGKVREIHLTSRKILDT